MTASKKIVVTGGKGYLGGVTSRILKSRGFHPILLDRSIDSGGTKVPQNFPLSEFYSVDLSDWSATDRVFSKLGNVHSIMHFAGLSDILSSMEDPWTCFHNNINATLNIAECASKYKIPYLISSSSSAVYGSPQKIPVSEDLVSDPSNPYGESKSIIEGILKQFTRWKNIQVMNLRYFNPAGIDLETNAGEPGKPDTQLISYITRCFKSNEAVEIFGADFPTPDGTSIRDYVHVKDLVEAQILALDYLEKHPEVRYEVVNVGTGTGFSVKQVIKFAEEVFGTKLKVNYLPRRPGDPPELVADTHKMLSLFKWRPKITLTEIISDEWKFRKNSSRVSY